jgi:4-hydroxy-2-oxoheptanedioate aldolase
MVPHVKTAQEAKQIAEQTRFYPIGMRALDGGNADGAYAAVPTARYIEHANHERFVVVQIEDPQAMEQLDDIAATPGIDMLFFGPGDYSQGLGIPGQIDDPRIEQARRRVAEAAERHGKFAGTVSGPDRIPATIDLGYRFISVGADVVALGNAFRQTIARFDSATNGHTSKTTDDGPAPNTAPRVY